MPGRSVSMLNAATAPTQTAGYDTLLFHYTGIGADDMARKRLQQKGHLYEQGGWWKLRWRVDVLDVDGNIKREWSTPVWVCESKGPHANTRRQAQRIAWEEYLSKLDANNRTPMTAVSLAEFVTRKFIPEHVATLKTSGRVHYESCLKHIMPVLGHIKLRDVTVTLLQAFIAKLQVKDR